MITVYGKDGCSYCQKAVALLEMKKVPYEYLKVGEQIAISEFTEAFPGVRTVPYILNRGNVIGGYTDLQKYFEDTNSGFGDDF